MAPYTSFASVFVFCLANNLKNPSQKPKHKLQAKTGKNQPETLHQSLIRDISLTLFSPYRDIALAFLKRNDPLPPFELKIKIIDPEAIRIANSPDLRQPIETLVALGCSYKYIYDCINELPFKPDISLKAIKHFCYFFLNYDPENQLSFNRLRQNFIRLKTDKKLAQFFTLPSQVASEEITAERAVALLGIKVSLERIIDLNANTLHLIALDYNDASKASDIDRIGAFSIIHHRAMLDYKIAKSFPEVNKSKMESYTIKKKPNDHGKKKSK